MYKIVVVVWKILIEEKALNPELWNLRFMCGGVCLANHVCLMFICLRKAKPPHRFGWYLSKAGVESFTYHWSGRHRVPLEPEGDERWRHQYDAGNEYGREIERSISCKY